MSHTVSTKQASRQRAPVFPLHEPRPRYQGEVRHLLSAPGARMGNVPKNSHRREDEPRPLTKDSRLLPWLARRRSPGGGGVVLPRTLQQGHGPEPSPKKLTKLRALKQLVTFRAAEEAGLVVRDTVALRWEPPMSVVDTLLSYRARHVLERQSAATYIDRIDIQIDTAGNRIDALTKDSADNCTGE